MRIYTGKLGAGRDRDYHAIKRWLDEKGILVCQVAEDVGLDRSTASHTIRGALNNRKVLRRLVELECPHDILSLPQDMKEAIHVQD